MRMRNGDGQSLPVRQTDCRRTSRRIRATVQEVGQIDRQRETEIYRERRKERKTHRQRQRRTNGWKEIQEDK